jgi:hypothetical protein
LNKEKIPEARSQEPGARSQDSESRIKKLCLRLAIILGVATFLADS